MSTGNDKIIRMMGSAVFAVTALLAAAGASGLAAALARSGPRVGDIITFQPSRSVQADPAVRVLVTRSAQFACVLDLDTISHGGGSLILEAQLAGDSRAFIVHWAGDRTSTDAADCGKAADLIVDRRGIDALAVAAGGNGAAWKESPLATNAIASDSTTFAGVLAGYPR